MSPSISPSVSPSISKSPSVSPSLSPSISPSVSPSALSQTATVTLKDEDGNTLFTKADLAESATYSYYFDQTALAESPSVYSPLQVPLAGKALDLITQHEIKRVICSKFLFPDTKTYKKPIDIRSAWNAALKRSEIKDFRFHDLRHCCASYLAMNGCTIVEIAGVLGHKTLQMVKRYAHLSDSHLSEVVSKMNEKILG